MEVLKTFSNFDQDKLAIKLLRPNYFDSWFIPREYWSPSSLKLSGGIRNFILRATACSLCSPTPPTDLSVLSPQDLCITTSIFYAPTSWELYLKTESVVSRVWLFATPWTMPTKLLCPWNSLGKNTGVDCHFIIYFLENTWHIENVKLTCRRP